MRKSIIDFDSLRNRLKVHSQASELTLRQHHPEADKFFQNFKPVRLLSSGILAGSLFLSSGPTIPTPKMADLSKNVQNISTDKPEFLQLDTSQKIKKVLPVVGDWKLSPEQENNISQIIQEEYGVEAKAELEGNRLNNAWGRMGAEQLLPRYPGDSAAQHGEFVEKGQTPGLGGWGYFAYSRDKMTQELFDTEKYYVAVQTLYLPNWGTDTRRLSKWYKYRRMVAVNPANGKAMVVAVADAGPANWTGKHFGGSPKVMNYLGIDYGRQNHPVVLFFLDDPNHEVPLGPLEYNREKNKKEIAFKI